MDFFDNGSGGKGKKGCDGDGSRFVQPGEKDTQVQLVISLALGLTAFLAFCVCLPDPNSLADSHSTKAKHSR